MTATTFVWNGWRPQGTSPAIINLTQAQSPALTKRFDSIDNWLTELGANLTPSNVSLHTDC